MQDLDDADKKLLRLLQENNKQTAEELGELVSLSTSAVQRRLKRLRDDKIIEADISIISQEVAGPAIFCIVDVILKDGDSTSITEFKRSMKLNTSVMQCYYVTGTYDFVIIVNVPDMSQFEEFSRKSLMDHPNVKHFYTHVVMDKVKSSYRVLI